MTAIEIIYEINAEIKRKSISNYFIAKQLQVSKSTVTNWLTGKTYPDLHQFVAILQLLELDLKIKSKPIRSPF